MGADKSSRPVAIWLLVGVGMLIIQIALGGITRLTGSGLSITEWDVITGTLPPIGEAAWMEEFAKYQQTPQYRLLNTDFDLGDFKFIYFWEWIHRFWARLIGVVFVIGFVTFLIQRRLKAEMLMPFIILFLLGALQGAIGWIMVASGLTGDAIYVKPTRLALHFIFAMLLVGYNLWFAMKLLIPASARSFSRSLVRFNWVLISLLALQLVYGALMAGHRAAPAAPTWPDINGTYLPGYMFSHKPFLLNFIDNRILIHFIHRNLAYLITLLVLWFTLSVIRKIKPVALLKRTIWLPVAFTLLQVALGIFSVLTSTRITPNGWGTFEWMAQLHQLGGMMLLLSLVYTLYLLTGSKNNKIPGSYF